MSSPRKVTTEQLRAINNIVPHQIMMWHGISVTIRPLITFKEVREFVDSVMRYCYDSEKNIFVPEAKDYAFRINTVMRYSCVDLPEDAEEAYSILYNTDLFESVYSRINKAQIESIKEAIDICLRK